MKHPKSSLWRTLFILGVVFGAAGGAVLAAVPNAVAGDSLTDIPIIRIETQKTERAAVPIGGTVLSQNTVVEPGTYAEIWLKEDGTESQSLISVPMAAVAERGGLPMIIVVDGQGMAELRLVRLGGELPNGHVVIDYGLVPGERVLARNAAQISSGVRVGEASP